MAGLNPSIDRELPSVRVVVESLAVAGLVWLASNVQNQNTAIARLQVQLTQVQASLADIPGLTQRVAEARIQLAEHERRIGRLDDAKPKDWTK